MFQLSKKFALPTEFVTWKAAAIGRTGSGKTNTAIVLAEQMIEQGFPCVIIDPQGDWWGLRSKYSMPILGGRHGDIPLEAHNGELAADFVIEHRVPVLLDLIGMTESEMVRFGSDFAKRLWHKNEQAVHVFLDEADLFAPQSNAKGPKAQCLGAWQNVIRRGRSRGIGCTMLTQRSAVINKDLLTQADPLIVHRLTAPPDLAAVEAYLDAHGMAKKDQKNILADIAKLPTGSAWVISPGSLGIEPTRIEVRHRSSFDSSAAPEVGKAGGKPKAFQAIDIDALSAQFAETVERAKEEDPKLLRARIAELTHQLNQQTPAVDQQAIDAAVEQAKADRDAHWSVLLDQARESIRVQGDTIAAARDILNKGIRSIDVDSVQVRFDPTLPDNAMRFEPPMKREPLITGAGQDRPPPRALPAPSTNGSLPKAERKILTALAQYPQGRSRVQIAVLTCYACNGGGFRNALGALRSKSYIEGDDHLTITAAGKKALGSFEPLPIGRALAEHWMAQLGKAEKEILAVAMRAYPKALTKEQIAAQTESQYEPTGGGFRNALGKLRTLELISGKDTISASPNLFG